MTVVEQCRGVCACDVPVGGDHDALAGGQSVVLDHPGMLTGRGSEPIERGIEFGRIVNGLAACRANTRGRHHILRKGLGALDAGGVLRRAEAGDTGGAHRIGDSPHQWDLRTDHHQIGGQPPRQRGDVIR